MAELELEGQKTKSIGYLSKKKVKDQLGKTWTDYEAAVSQFAKAKQASAKAKDAVREVLKKKLNQTGSIDFTDDGERIRVFENLGKKGKTRTSDLSDLLG